MEDKQNELWEEPPSIAGNDFKELENSLVKWKAGISSQKAIDEVQLSNDPSVVVTGWVQFLDQAEERKHWSEEMKKRIKERDFDTAITIQKLRVGEDGSLVPFQSRSHFLDLKKYYFHLQAKFFENSDQTSLGLLGRNNDETMKIWQLDLNTLDLK